MRRRRGVARVAAAAADDDGVVCVAGGVFIARGPNKPADRIDDTIAAISSSRARGRSVLTSIGLHASAARTNNVGGTYDTRGIRLYSSLHAVPLPYTTNQQHNKTHSYRSDARSSRDRRTETKSHYYRPIVPGPRGAICRIIIYCAIDDYCAQNETKFSDFRM